MATESKWAERFWSVVGRLAAAAGGGACVKVMIGSDAKSDAPKAAVVQPAPAMPTPCHQPPPVKATCGTPAKWSSAALPRFATAAITSPPASSKPFGTSLFRLVSGDALLELLDHPVITRRCFHPRQPPYPAPTLWVDVGGLRLGCYVRRTDPAAGWVVHFHGNGETAAENDHYRGDLFADAGVNVCFAEYRGCGWSDGVPALAAMLPDGKRVVAALGVPAERVVAFGRSLGSLYAIELACRLPGLGGLVLESGIASPFEQWKFVAEGDEIGCGVDEIEAAVAVHFDHRVKLGGYAGPVLVMHAEQDRLVPKSNAERMRAWAGGADKRLVLFPHGDHNTIFSANAADYTAELHTFLKRVLG